MAYQGLVPKLVLEGSAPTYTLYTEEGCTHSCSTKFGAEVPATFQVGRFLSGSCGFGDLVLFMNTNVAITSGQTAKPLNKTQSEIRTAWSGNRNTE